MQKQKKKKKNERKKKTHTHTFQTIGNVSKYGERKKPIENDFVIKFII